MYTMSTVKYEGHYQIRADEVTPDKRMKVPALIKLMQEGSMQNSLQKGFSVWDLEPDNISWVLLRKKLVINNYPILGDRVIVATYPIVTEKVLAYRDYKVYNESGENLLAYASSTWTLINLKTRKLERIPKKFHHLKAPKEEEILDPPASKINRPNRIDFQKSFNANWFDTDWNDHVNNVFFIKCMIESSPVEFLKNKVIKELVYHIRSESLLGDQLEVKGEINEPINLRYSLGISGLDKMIAYAEIKWSDSILKE